MKVEPLTMSILLSASETAESKFEVTFPTGNAYASIPKLLTLDDSELKLQFNNLKINEVGEITAANMVMPNGSQCDVALSDPRDLL